MTTTLQDRVDLIENPESRVACIVIIDVSGSMSGAPIREANAGIQRFAAEIRRDELTALRADTAIIAFQSQYKVIQRFGEDLDYTTAQLVASGGTHMAPPIHHALDMIDARKQEYRNAGIAYYRPIIMLITDGKPEHDSPDDLEHIAQRIKAAEAAKSISFFSVGTETADLTQLAKLSNLPPRTLRGTSFVELFQWLSNSITAISQSQLGDEVQLPSTDGWSVY